MVKGDDYKAKNNSELTTNRELNYFKSILNLLP